MLHDARHGTSPITCCGARNALVFEASVRVASPTSTLMW